jgi:cytochrome P450
MLMRLLSPRVVDVWRETRIRPILSSLFDRFQDRGEVELVGAVTEKLPIRVIVAGMGLPYTDDEWVARCKHDLDELSAFFGVHSLEDAELTKRALAASARLDELLNPVVAERRDSDGEDLVSRLWREGPAALPDWNEIDVRANLRVLFFAGTDTTGHTMANAFHLLMTREGLADTLREGGDKAVANFVEEALRLYAAVHFRPRVANDDVELAGVRIGKDDHILPVDLAANRDPAKYRCPHDLDLDRPAPRDHLAFHFGPRACAGAALARAELQETVKMTLERLPDLRLDPRREPPVFRGFMARSYRPLHATFTPI